ncbi:MAG: M20/M25/M40 family metallo-hydrolase [Candidatus Peribacteraceae bacterium]|nr:M20/M25/M40 family metallo-hydrolase [Candidatus Peribacteraceae bacterium]
MKEIAEQYRIPEDILTYTKAMVERPSWYDARTGQTEVKMHDYIEGVLRAHGHEPTVLLVPGGVNRRVTVALRGDRSAPARYFLGHTDTYHPRHGDPDGTPEDMCRFRVNEVRRRLEGVGVGDMKLGDAQILHAFLHADVPEGMQLGAVWVPDEELNSLGMMAFIRAVKAGILPYPSLGIFSTEIPTNFFNLRKGQVAVVSGRPGHVKYRGEVRTPSSHGSKDTVNAHGVYVDLYRLFRKKLTAESRQDMPPEALKVWGVQYGCVSAASDIMTNVPGCEFVWGHMSSRFSIPESEVLFERWRMEAVKMLRSRHARRERGGMKDATIEVQLERIPQDQATSYDPYFIDPVEHPDCLAQKVACILDEHLGKVAGVVGRGKSTSDANLARAAGFDVAESSARVNAYHNPRENVMLESIAPINHLLMRLAQES